MWVNDGGVRFFRSGRGHVWVSLAMSEPGPSFVIVLDCTLSLILLVSLFLSMLVIRDFCSSLPQPVQKQLSALKYGIEIWCCHAVWSFLMANGLVSLLESFGAQIQGVGVGGSMWAFPDFQGSAVSQGSVSLVHLVTGNAEWLEWPPC